MTKNCPKCGETRPTSDFYKNTSRADGLASQCKICVKAYQRERYHTNPQAREVVKAATNRNRKRGPARHGLTQQQFDALSAQTAGMCQICLRVPHEHIDHDHACCPGETSCGKCVRGLLCGGCNRGIGLLRDDVDTLARAQVYLTAERHTFLV